MYCTLLVTLTNMISVWVAPIREWGEWGGGRGWGGEQGGRGGGGWGGGGRGRGGGGRGRGRGGGGGVAEKKKARPPPSRWSTSRTWPWSSRVLGAGRAGDAGAGRAGDAGAGGDGSLGSCWNGAPLWPSWRVLGARRRGDAAGLLPVWAPNGIQWAGARPRVRAGGGRGGGRRGGGRRGGCCSQRKGHPMVGQEHQGILCLCSVLWHCLTDLFPNDWYCFCLTDYFDCSCIWLTVSNFSWLVSLYFRLLELEDDWCHFCLTVVFDCNMQHLYKKKKRNEKMYFDFKNMVYVRTFVMVILLLLIICFGL